MKKLAILLSAAAISITMLTGCNSDKLFPAEVAHEKQLITRADASAVALSSLGLTKADTEYTVVTENASSELPTYDVEILVDGVVYKYRIDAAKGDLLKVTVNNQEVAIEDIPKAFSSQESGYISLEDAKRIAFEDAGVSETELIGFEQEMDYALGKYLFELEFSTASHKYEYEIDATDGTIFKKDIDGKTLLKPTAPAAPEQAEPAEYISSEQAEDAALGHAGVERSASVFERTQWKLSKGTAIYEVEFISAGVEYEYKINALTGAVISFEKEGKPLAEQENATYISSSEALGIALAHAGLREEDVKGASSEPDVENGKTVYEIEFNHGGYEYEYKIDAITGEILHTEKERD